MTTLDGRYFSLVRRYSSFHQLYLQCRDHYYVTTAFPPKTLSNSSGRVREGAGEIVTTDFVSQVLDSRRQGLELYLQALTTIQPIPVELLEFLDLQDISLNQSDQPGNIEALHWDISTNIKLISLADFETPVLQVLTDFNHVGQESEDDMITQSTLQAFYGEI